MLLAVACSDAPDPASTAPSEPALARAEAVVGPDFEADKNVSHDAKAIITSELYTDTFTPRHPGDGGGRAWLISLQQRRLQPGSFDEPSESVQRGIPARIRIGFEVGEEGIQVGGALYLQNSPFWHWEKAQADAPDAGGYTAIVDSPNDVTLETASYTGGLVAFTVRGRPLEAGEQLELEYGAGPKGAVVDDFVDREARIWLHVDADGDGIRKPVASSPFIETHASSPVLLLLRAPTTAQPGEALELRISLLDARANAGTPFKGSVNIEAQEGLDLPDRVEFRAEDLGSVGVPFRATRAGYFRIKASLEVKTGKQPRQLSGETEPLLVRDGVPRILWADLHGHSGLSDGTGTPEDYFRYARDIAALDVIALTDHDHWGMRALDAHPEMWDRIQRATREAHEPGRFVTILGYEWTSWLHGHRHVLQFGDTGSLFSSIDRERRYETPAQLWTALRGKPALTFAHHSAGGPVSTNWNYPPDPILEPITEVVSVHGSSEAPDSPKSIYSPVPGNFVRDILNRGFTLGMIGSGDSHDGHPGLTHLSSSVGASGLAAIFSEDRTREGVLAAMRARRVYATNGPRIFLRTTLDERYEMGARLDASDASGSDGETHKLTIRVAAVSELERVDVIRSGEVVLSFDGEGMTEWARTGEIPRLQSGEYLYVRVIQRDKGAAWSSPFFGPLSASN